VLSARRKKNSAYNALYTASSLFGTITPTSHVTPIYHYRHCFTRVHNECKRAPHVDSIRICFKKKIRTSVWIAK
jgi:hypothetical protein